MSTLFISDLHLDESRPDITRAFLHLLNSEVIDADSLYILGDFFETWIGDDDDTPLHQTIIQSLQQVTEKHTPIYIMHGNRDFLLGGDFCRHSGCQLIADPSVIELYGKKILLMHGDILCTQDINYMKFREMVRDEQWQQELLIKTLNERRALATQLRENSKEAISNKAEDIMDVTPSEVISMMNKHDVNLLIHGHTHRPNIHDVALNNDSGKRIVLGDWDDNGWLLRYEKNHSYQLEKFNL